MEDKIKEFWKQKQVVFHHIFLDVMLLIYCIGVYFAANQEVRIRYAVLFVYALLCVVTELVHNHHVQKKYVHSIFHLFVLAGSILHFFMILFYVIL